MAKINNHKEINGSITVAALAMSLNDQLKTVFEKYLVVKSDTENITSQFLVHLPSHESG